MFHLEGKFRTWAVFIDSDDEATLLLESCESLEFSIPESYGGLSSHMFDLL